MLDLITDCLPQAKLRRAGGHPGQTRPADHLRPSGEPRDCQAHQDPPPLSWRLFRELWWFSIFTKTLATDHLPQRLSPTFTYCALWKNYIFNGYFWTLSVIHLHSINYLGIFYNWIKLLINYKIKLYESKKLLHLYAKNNNCLENKSVYLHFEGKIWFNCLPFMIHKLHESGPRMLQLYQKFWLPTM